MEHGPWASATPSSGHKGCGPAQCQPHLQPLPQGLTAPHFAHSAWLFLELNVVGGGGAGGGASKSQEPANRRSWNPTPSLLSCSCCSGSVTNPLLVITCVHWAWAFIQKSKPADVLLKCIGGFQNITSTFHSWGLQDKHLPDRIFITSFWKSDALFGWWQLGLSPCPFFCHSRKSQPASRGSCFSRETGAHSASDVGPHRWQPWVSSHTSGGFALCTMRRNGRSLLRLWGLMG